jgi:divalent metal cation (Fe/Co/Zn/Cd) transporter
MVVQSHDAAGLHRRALRLEWFTVSWNVIEAGVAITAGVIAGSAALVGFGVDSGIEVSSAVALLWRFRRAGPSADLGDRRHAERRALFLVSGTFAALGAYIVWEAAGALLRREVPDTSLVGIGLAAASLIVMPLLVFAKQRTAPADAEQSARSRCDGNLGLHLSIGRPARRAWTVCMARLVVGRSRRRAVDGAGDHLAGVGDVS